MVIELSPRAADVRYGRHDRYWIPLDHPLVVRFYLNHLFVPHSRRELLQGAVARAVPRSRWTARLVDRPHSNGLSESSLRPPEGTRELGNPLSLEGISLEYLASLLEEHLRPAGLAFSGSLACLMLEDYKNSQRRQTVLFLFDGASPTPGAVAKIANNESQRAVLGHEFNALMALQRKLGQELRATIPQPLALIKPGQGSVLLETYMPGRSIYFDMRNTWHPRRRASDHFQRAQDWLVQFQQATKMREVRLDEWTIRDHVLYPLENFQQHSDSSPHERDMIHHTIQLAHKLRGERLPLVARQGDFWARNLIVNGNTVGVVDWERFRQRSTPFSDLFMFATSYGLSYPWKVGRWAEPVAAFRATYLERSWLAHLVQEYLLAYCQAMQVSPEMLEVFFPVFLAERALEEKELSGLAGSWEPQTGKWLWRSLFHEYAHHGGSVCFG